MKINIKEKKLKEREYTWEQMVRHEGLFENKIIDGTNEMFFFLVIDGVVFVVDKNKLIKLPLDTGWKCDNDLFIKSSNSITLEF